MGKFWQNSQILLPDKTTIPFNKSYLDGKPVLASNVTFLPYIAASFGSAVDPTAIGIGKILTLTGSVKSSFDWKENNNDGKNSDKAFHTNAAVMERVYTIGTLQPLVGTRITLLPTADYPKIGYKRIVADKVSEHKNQMRVLARKTLLKIMVEEAKNYKEYKINGVDGDANITASTAISVDNLAKEIDSKYYVGVALDENKLYEADAIIKITNAVIEKFATKGTITDKYHPTFIDGFGANEIIAITTQKVINSIVKSSTYNLTQLIQLPGGINTQATVVNGIKFIPDPLVQTIGTGKTRIIYIKADAYGFIQDPIQNETFVGKVETGNQRGLTILDKDNAEKTINIMPNDATLTFNRTAYAGQMMKGCVVVVNVK